MESDVAVKVPGSDGDICGSSEVERYVEGVPVCTQCFGDVRGLKK